MSSSHPFLRFLLILCGTFSSLSALADGMQPQSTIVILDEADGEATMAVTNTDDAAALLYTQIQDVAEDTDTDSVVIATPPVARVESGQVQLVRFILQGAPLRTQRLKRVTFEGIGRVPQASGQAVVAIGVRQNLPLLLHPRGLARNNTPWTLLSWTLRDGKLTVVNDSPYVIRLASQVSLLPSMASADLGRNYLLAGETVHADVKGPVTDGDTAVRIKPASVYGFAVDQYDASLR